MWKPETGSRQEWLKYHGMKKEMFLEVKALVKTCNILTAANANRTVSTRVSCHGVILAVQLMGRLAGWNVSSP